MNSDMDMSPYFARLEELMHGVDKIFQKMSNDYSAEVQCDQGCTDCCYALFDLSLVEALYLNKKFSGLDQDTRNMILIQADKADRKIHKIKKQLIKAHRAGSSETEVLRMAGGEQVQCPLLVQEKCVLYASRPMTCRIYGLPMKVGETSVTCSLSRFEPGIEYPTVDMQRLQDQLLHLSRDLVRGIGSSYADLHMMLVPVSMALLTEYDHNYLGIKIREEHPEPETSKKEGPTREWVLGSKE